MARRHTRQIALAGKSIMGAGSTSADFEKNSANISFVRGMVQPISNIADSLDSMTAEQEKHFSELIAVMKQSVRSNDDLEATQKEMNDRIAALIASLKLDGEDKNKEAIARLTALHHGPSGKRGSGFLRTLLGEDFEYNRRNGAGFAKLLTSGAGGFWKGIMADFGVQINKNGRSENLKGAVNRHMNAQSTLDMLGGDGRLAKADDSGYGLGRAPNGTGSPKAILNRIAREVTLIRMVVEGRVKYMPGSKKNAERESYQKMTYRGGTNKPAMFTNLAKHDKELIEAVKHAIENKGIPMPKKDRDVDLDTRDDHDKILASNKNNADATRFEADDDDKQNGGGSGIVDKVVEGVGGLLGGAAGVAGIGVLGKMGKFLSRGFFGKEVAKGAEKVVAKEGTKIAEKTAIKAGEKTLAKGLIKKLPVIGLLAGVGFGISRMMDGDKVGAMGEVASGAASMIPGIGTAASLGIDGALLARDIKKSADIDSNPNNAGDAMESMDNLLAAQRKPTTQTPAAQIIPVSTPVTQRIVETQTMLPTRPTDNSFLRYLDKRAVRSL
jgi:hypothetical protein